MLRAAALFYAAFAVAAVVWGAVAGRPCILWIDAPPTGTQIFSGIGLGIGFGLLVVGASHWTLMRFAWAQALVRWFRETLGPLSCQEAFALAVLSGISEELLFRGALQPSFGLWPATFLFALMHVPPRRDLVPWTLSAAGLGLCFGLSLEWTGNIVAAVVAHFTINFLNLRAIGKTDG